MTLPPQWSPKEVIDLTGDDDDDVERQVQSPPSRLPSAVANSIEKRYVNGIPAGNSHGHPYVQPRPAPVQPPYRSLTASTPPYASSPPAKRQKLSEPPYGTAYEEQLITASVGQHLSSYARGAVEALNNKDLDKDKLRSEIQSVLAKHFGSTIRQNGRLPDSAVSDVKARAKSLAQKFALLPGFRRTRFVPSPLSNFPPAERHAPPPARASRPIDVQAPTARPPDASASRYRLNGLPSAVAPARPPAHIYSLPTTVGKARQHPASEPLSAQPIVTPATQSRPPTTLPSTQPRTPSSKRARSAATTASTSPENFRARARVAAWKSSTESHGVEKRPSTAYCALEHRPYRDAKTRQEILKGNGRLTKMKSEELKTPHVFHVDFTLGEAQKVQLAVRKAVGSEKKHDDPYKDLARLLKKLKRPGDLIRLASQLEIEKRNADDISAFLADVLQKKATDQEPRVLSIEKDQHDRRGEALRDSRLSSLLMAREVSGNRFRTRRMRDLTNELCKNLEDGLRLRKEFSNCAGDISTVSWISNSVYIAGTTAHMDSHNQQYNRAGNLVLGLVSQAQTKLKSFADHRILRPIVQTGENSTAEMRASQDLWLYTSVVSSDHDPIHHRTYTSGFDRSAKVWRVEESGSSMQCVGTWKHDGIVNFVQASQVDHPAGLVATAADVPTGAVRIYTVKPDDVSNSTYASYSARRVPDADGTFSTKWTYFPSTMKWGVEESVRHLLLVGFSPRSLTEDENDIPEDRLNTGELCMWDGLTGQAVRIPSANSQNVFEVLWHPYRPEFIVASSPAGDFDADIRTQVRIYVRDRSSEHDIHFKFLKSFDCTALDVNELTIMPNSPSFYYITAGCTDGKTYVWDSAQPETLRRRPVHVLAHGPPLEDIAVGDHEDDTGVKFTAWATSMDRFYTGSSDGVVKVWNIRGGEAKGRVLLEAQAQISHGAFSPDYSKLVVGDASGRVFVLSVDEDDEDEEKPASLANLNGPRGPVATNRRGPTQITPHPEPPSPQLILEPVIEIGRAYVTARQLRFSGDRAMGMVQDINYADTGLFRREAHAEHDPTRELMAYVEYNQQVNYRMFANDLIRTRPVKNLGLSNEGSDGNVIEGGEPKASEVARRHEKNCKLDLDFEGLSLETRHALEKDRVPLEELCDGVEYYGLEEIDEVEENLQEGRC